MKRTFPTIQHRDRWLAVHFALATHFTPDGAPCTYRIADEVWHVPRNAPLLLTKVV